MGGDLALARGCGVGSGTYTVVPDAAVVDAVKDRPAEGSRRPMKNGCSKVAAAVSWALLQ